MVGGKDVVICSMLAGILSMSSCLDFEREHDTGMPTFKNDGGREVK